MVVNQLLQLDLGRGIQMITYAYDIAISISNMGETEVYQKMTTALERIEFEAARLGLKFSPSKYEEYGTEAKIRNGILKSLARTSPGDHQ